MPPERLRKECDPTVMHCETTGELIPLTGIIEQDRAVRALGFGLEIKEKGFNVYVAGYPGTGRTTAVRGFLEAIAGKKPVPSDWCYVNNFKNPYQPKALKLPPGMGKTLQNDMANFIEQVRNVIPRSFESEDYAAKRGEMIKAFENERKELFSKLDERAKREGFIIESTPIGLIILPVVGGKALRDEEI